MVISSTRTSNERKEIDTLMTKLAEMVVETGVGLIQIVHLKRTTGEKSYAHGGEVELTDLRGSAALEQLSWAVVGLERDQQGDDHNFSRVRILKNRTVGFTGLCDTLYYDPMTGRLKNAVPEVEELEEKMPHED
jgi:twinkle protein